jgi:hypothetical protein
MGSSHSYLQNLDAAAANISIHHMEFGLCLESMVPADSWMVKYSKVGTCVDEGFVQPDKAAYNVFWHSALTQEETTNTMVSLW